MNKKTRVGLILYLIILVIVISNKSNDGSSTDETKLVNDTVYLGTDTIYLDAVPVNTWILVKSDTIEPRIKTMLDIGLTGSQLEDRLISNGSLSKTYIHNYFVKNGRVKKFSTSN